MPSFSLRRLPHFVLVLAAAVALAGCAAQNPGTSGDDYDPFEATNRDVHNFNKGLDKAILRPVSKGYVAVMPDHLETRLVMFSENLSLPSDVVNNALQLNMRGAFSDLGRFVVNSTLGLAGFFDPATEIGMKPGTDTDFGETLMVMGVGEGPFVSLPFFGPKTSRAAVGLIGNYLTNPLRPVLEPPASYIRIGPRIAAGLTQRDQLSDTIDQVLYESADSYAITRSIYLQNRRFKLGGSSGAGYTDPYDSLPGGAAAAGAAEEPGTELESPYE